MSWIETQDEAFVAKLFLFNAAIPAFLLGWDYAHNQLGANPVEAITRTTGILALVLVVLTLTITPLAQLFAQPWLIRRRRALGLAAFYYALAHFLTYVFFDRGGDLASVPADVAKRPFILVGFASFVLMVPLAVTSTNAMIRRLGGKRWKQLHRLTYAIMLGGLLHYALIVKSDLRYPIDFGLVVIVLFLLRNKYISSRARGLLAKSSR